jgi:cytosine/adenosine deaminase-related metal-dependent hydrolase
MKEAAQLARAHKGVHLHSHLAEDLDEETYCAKVYGMRSVDFAESVGWLGPDVWFAHAIFLDDREIRDDVGALAPGMSADFIAVKRNQLGLSGTERDPLAALIMCGPFKVDYSFINGQEIISRGEFTNLDVEELLASHRQVMARIYKQ